MFATRNNRINVIQLLLQKEKDVNKWEYWGDTHVHHAAIYNSPEATEILVEHEALINNTSRIMTVKNQLRPHTSAKVKQQFIYRNNYK